VPQFLGLKVKAVGYVSQKRLYLPSSLYISIIQKTNTDIFTSVRTFDKF
jgi:hypothetical protein